MEVEWKRQEEGFRPSRSVLRLSILHSARHRQLHRSRSISTTRPIVLPWSTPTRTPSRSGGLPRRATSLLSPRPPTLNPAKFPPIFFSPSRRLHYHYLRLRFHKLHPPTDPLPLLPSSPRVFPPLPLSTLVVTTPLIIKISMSPSSPRFLTMLSRSLGRWEAGSRITSEPSIREETSRG